jgi:NADH-quinone oxidoreductase subunit E
VKHNSTVPSADTMSSPQVIHPEVISKIVEKHDHDMGGLIAILEELQSEYGYLPEESLRIVSQRTGRSLVDVYSVATFYRCFSLKPKGKHLVCACLGTACHVRGAPRVVAELEQQLGIKSGETTDDKEFTLETVNCLGACALGPVVVIDGRYFSKVRRSKVKQLLTQAREGFDQYEMGKDERIFPLETGCSSCGHSLMDETFILDGHPSIKLNLTVGHGQGWARLSCLYGSCTVATEFEIPGGAVVDFACPHCGSGMKSTWDCPECESPMASMRINGGGVVQVCSRRGCKGHILDLL